MFGKMPQLLVNGDETYNSFCGASLSIIILLIVIPYSYQRYYMMVTRNNTNYAEEILSNEYVKAHLTPSEGVRF